MTQLFTAETEIDDAVLTVLAHLPTASLAAAGSEAFYAKLGDRELMRLAVLLAQKSYDEGGCPIGAVIVEDGTGRILGKGHNTLVQENHPYNHGETSAIRDAGRQDFSRATLYTSLSPCNVCATLLYMRQFRRLVVGDVTNASGNEEMLREKGLQVDILEDPVGIELYARFHRENPELDLEDWMGKAAAAKGLERPG